MPTVPAAGYPTGPEAPPQIEPRLPVDDFLRIDARPEAFGGAVGTALTRAGGELEKGAGELAQAAISRQDFFNKVASDNANTEFMKESHKLFYGDPDAGVNPVTGQANKPGFFALKGQDAIDAGPPNDALDKLQRDIGARLPNDRARLDFNTETRRLRTYQDGEISRHWDEQLKTAGTTTLAAKADLHDRDAATYFNDPTRLADILETGRQDATKAAQIANGMNADPAILADARAKSDAKIYGSAYRAAIAAGQLDRADALKNEAIARGIWTGQQADEAERLIEPKRNQQIGKDAGRAGFTGTGGGGGGQFNAPPGAPIAGATPDEQQMLNEIRARESTTNYTSIGPVAKGQGHFGAYQFDPPTWQDAAAGTGLGKEYATADKAPKEIQDANALWLLRHRGTQPWAASGPYPALGGAAGKPTAAAGGVGVPPGTIDKTAEAGFGTKFGPLENPQGMIIHHTGGGETVDAVINTFKQTGYPAQFVIDRQGKIYQTLPDGYRGQHIQNSSGPLGTGKTNANMEGVEIIANNDGDVLPVQEEAAARLVAARAAKWGYDPRTSVFGHGEVNPGHKEADEGMSTVTRIRNGSLPVTAPGPQVPSGKPETAPEGAIISSPGKPPLQNVGGKWVPYLPEGV